MTIQERIGKRITESVAAVVGVCVVHDGVPTLISDSLFFAVGGTPIEAPIRNIAVKKSY